VNLPFKLGEEVKTCRDRVKSLLYEEDGTTHKSYKDIDIDSVISLQKSLWSILTDMKKEVWGLLTDTWYRFIRNPDAIKALSIMRSLDRIPGGAMKARILGGYNESGDTEMGRGRR